MGLTIRIPWLRVRSGYCEWQDDGETKFSAVMAWAKEAEDAYLAAFGGSPPPDPGYPQQVNYGDDPLPEPPPEARDYGKPPNRTGLYCPDHPQVELVESAKQYQEYDPGPGGEPIPAKFYCPGRANPTGKNHTVWRSKAISR